MKMFCDLPLETLKSHADCKVSKSNTVVNSLSTFRKACRLEVRLDSSAVRKWWVQTWVQPVSYFGSCSYRSATMAALRHRQIADFQVQARARWFWGL